jgi:hypothetical protein
MSSNSQIMLYSGDNSEISPLAWYAIKRASLCEKFAASKYTVHKIFSKEVAVSGNLLRVRDPTPESGADSPDRTLFGTNR